uniref:Uncharacterized protein n=1 Tax=Oryza sativa subsp. japonica TaxID=39947 RepID=Q7EYV2_ORYSJ|nr:hypothetical protein [Oryza sativa Japonica Group]
MDDLADDLIRPLKPPWMRRCGHLPATSPPARFGRGKIWKREGSWGAPLVPPIPLSMSLHYRRGPELVFSPVGMKAERIVSVHQEKIPFGADNSRIVRIQIRT